VAGDPLPPSRPATDARADTAPRPAPSRGTAAEVARVFFLLGAIGFGGPVAHVALMEREVVRVRRWLPPDEFLDLLGLTNLIPGPNSSEMAMALGYRRAGWAGLLAGGLSFIFPAACITAALAWLYMRYGSLPEIQPWLSGLGPAVVALMVTAIARLARPALRDVGLAVIAVAVLALRLLGVNELILLLGGGAAALVRPTLRAGSGALALVSVLATITVAAQALASGAAARTVVEPTLADIGIFFARTGAVLYGGGYLLVALLEPLVTRGWLTSTQLVDAVAAGQVTPGPVLTTATFIGYLLGGLPGAGVATVSIFLPAFGFVAALGRIAPRLRRSPRAGRFLSGVNAAAVALMAAVTVTLARAALTDVRAGVIAAIALGAASRGLNGGWIVAIGLAAGALTVWMT
jgi:chromate transporter